MAEYPKLMELIFTLKKKIGARSSREAEAGKL